MTAHDLAEWASHLRNKYGIATPEADNDDEAHDCSYAD